MNDEDFNRIVNISKSLNPKDLILFWQFTIETIEELNIVSNSNLSVEMFLIRLIYLKDIKKIEINDIEKKKELNENFDNEKKIPNNNKTVNQIKNISQQDKLEPKMKSENINSEVLISNFEDLLNLCNKKKEIKLKYELEKNVNLVKFEKNRIEISFNESLDKDFVKNLSSKLYEWTGERWIITFSKLKGQISVKDKQRNVKKELINEIKNSEIFKDVIYTFPDAELVDVDVNNRGADNE